MKHYRYLVLLTSAYPLYDGEFFLDDEINILASKFEKIFILCFHNNQKSAPRFFPKNVTAIPVRLQYGSWNTISTASLFFKKELWHELLNIKSKFNSNPSFLHFKIILASLSKSNFILKSLHSFLSTVDINHNNILFYSYWHDEMALALSFYKQQNNGAICISRAHGWDVDYKRHKPAYLPFKHFVVQSLDNTYTISQSGKTTLDALLNANNKTKVSRLGKTNNRTPLLKTNNCGPLICSCSNIISLKRIHLIVDIIKALNIPEVTWIHFGDGPLRSELQTYAQKQIPNIRFEFKGIVPNGLILDFYAQNYVALFINVSETEGIPVSIMEAQSSGIPVLATDVGGVSEIVNDENGFLIPKLFQPNNVAKVISSYLNAPLNDQTLKRKLSYENWDKNYNAGKNYNAFYNAITSL